MKKIGMIITIFERDINIRLQSISMVINMVITPLSYLLFLGLGLNYMMKDIMMYGKHVSYLLYIFPGIVAISVLSVSRLCGNVLHIEKRSGMLETIFSSPINRGSFLLGKILSTFVLCCLQCIALYITTYLLTLTDLLLNLNFIIVFFLSIFLCVLSLSGLNLILASVIRNEDNFNAISNIIFAPLSFISTAFFPENALPKILVPIAKINPISYTADVLRLSLASKYNLTFLTDLSVMVIMSILVMFISYRFMQRISPIG